MQNNKVYRLVLFCLLHLWLIFLLGFCLPAHAQTKTDKNGWQAGLKEYIDTKLTKKDGGYGWEDQPDSHLSPTFAVIGILQNLDQLPANREALIQFVRTHHPQRQANKEAGPSASQNRHFVFQQIQAIQWLGGDVADFKPEVNAWKSQAGNTGNYEKHKYPVLNQEMMTPICRSLLQLPVAPVADEFRQYLKSRQRANGSFNSAPVTAGGDGNILNTYWSLYALQVLREPNQLKKELIAWVNACQRPNGGFTHQPKPTLGGNDEVVYTWAAVKALALLGAKPQNTTTCLRYLSSLRNTDGGFGNQPGLPSNPEATYYAIDALKTLNRLNYLNTAPIVKRPVSRKPNFTGHQVYTVQFEASGSGSPAEAVMLADSLGIHLWGAKNGNPNWIITAQKIADEKKVPVTFFISDEPYGGSVSVPGFGTFNHILDYVAPASIGKVNFKDSTSWQDFQKTTMSQLRRSNGGLIMQISNNEPMARIILDESIKNGGYLGVSTVHFGQNFSFAQPYLHQYRFQLPFVTLQDAHGTESWWWGEELANHRTLFIAQKPTYDEMINALKKQWVVAVRHDSISAYKTRMLGGTAEARAFVQANEKSWRWWRTNNAHDNRPWAAITVLSPADSLEVAHPKQGVNIRVRCQWQGVRQFLHKPTVILQELRLNNEVVQPELVEKKDNKGVVSDSYYLLALANPKPGEHKVEATFKSLRNGKIRKQTAHFVIR
ncbi:hypothetical protein AAE02nite_49240 [Adhaeribacter aerolatus]|uniref:Geranylgeranyl transferase type II subunit beta n=1 Tax=Adhaeribacter aerolatus TaxID=670289 RepID=A0A512B5M4_9BACT|nr:prenyltransferase/squalene oxidase repeat-containing protein [Adhaeribacter aerolatus]GEO07260.1 hypothetical protein AAE02nite_49240 [Adhaeribacter aerolatus]